MPEDENMEVQEIVEDTDADTRDVADDIGVRFDALMERMESMQNAIVGALEESISKLAGISVSNGAVIRDYDEEGEDGEEEILDIDSLDLTV